VGTSAVQSATEKALYFFAYTFLKNGWVLFLCGWLLYVVGVCVMFVHELCVEGDWFVEMIVPLNVVKHFGDG
jgi:hypothetical protein